SVPRGSVGQPGSARCSASAARGRSGASEGQVIDVVRSNALGAEDVEGNAMSSTADLRLPFALRPLTPKLGAEISGIELAKGVSPEVFRAIYDAFLRYQVLLFPPQDVPPAAQVALARQFGEVQVHVMSMYHADGFPELYRLSNLDANGKPNGQH